MPVTWPTHKGELFLRGEARARVFCQDNGLPVPDVVSWERHKWAVNACAYYRPDTPVVSRHVRHGINVCVPLCATPATQGQARNWNWPGSLTDREPCGVVCHELGHHVDWLTGDKKGSYGSDYSVAMMKEADEPGVTSYAETNPWEWFAEAFRVFVMNPDLLRQLRPRTHALLAWRWHPVVETDWKTSLGTNVPDRIVKNLLRKGVGKCS